MSEPSDDFLTKLDLIDTHPELFLSKKDSVSKEELELLRQLVVGVNKIYKSKSPRQLKSPRKLSPSRTPNIN